MYRTHRGFIAEVSMTCLRFFGIFLILTTVARPGFSQNSSATPIEINETDFDREMLLARSFFEESIQEEKARKIMRQRVSCSHSHVPLTEFMRWVEDSSHLSTSIRPGIVKPLNSSPPDVSQKPSVDPNSLEIKAYFRNAPLSSILDHAFARTGLTWILENGSIVVLPSDVAAELRVRRVYNIGFYVDALQSVDFENRRKPSSLSPTHLAMSGGLGGVDATSLANNKPQGPIRGGDRAARSSSPTDLAISLIQWCTSGPWEDVDGIGGTITRLPGNLLQVVTTHRVHRETSALLEALDNLVDGKYKKGKGQYWNISEYEYRLTEKFHAPFDFAVQNLSLARACEELTRRTGLPFSLDKQSLDREQVVIDEISIQLLAGKDLSVTLNQALKPHELEAVVVKNGVCLVPQVTCEANVTIGYDVRDLARTFKETAEVEKAIMEGTDGPWVSKDHFGGQIDSVLPGVLLISQTPAEQESTQRLLAAIRLAKKTPRR